MSAPPRISRDLIADALTCRDGNVSAAAEDLGISRRGLYDRLQAFGINPADYRLRGGVTYGSSGIHSTGDDLTVDDCTLSNVRNEDPDVHASRSEKWHAMSPGHKLGSIMRGMGQAVGATVSEAVEDLSAAMVRKAQAAPRLKKNHLAWLHSLRRQLNAQWDADLTASDVLERFINWGGEEFAREMLEQRRKETPMLPPKPSEETKE